MARSFRLDAELERRLQEAAAREGVSASVFIRQAVEERCDVVLGRLSQVFTLDADFRVYPLPNGAPFELFPS